MSTRCSDNEAHIAAHGPLVADTGVHTGRSPKDKFVVRDAETDPVVWWDNNNAMTVEHFDTLLADFLAHAEGKTLFAQDLYGGADPALRVKRARLHRIRVALAVHPQPPDPSAGARSWPTSCPT